MGGEPAGDQWARGDAHRPPRSARPPSTPPKHAPIRRHHAHSPRYVVQQQGPEQRHDPGALHRLDVLRARRQLRDRLHERHAALLVLLEHLKDEAREDAVAGEGASGCAYTGGPGRHERGRGEVHSLEAAEAAWRARLPHTGPRRRLSHVHSRRRSPGASISRSAAPHARSVQSRPEGLVTLVGNVGHAPPCRRPRTQRPQHARMMPLSHSSSRASAPAAPPCLRDARPPSPPPFPFRTAF